MEGEMKFQFLLPTKLIFEKDCISKNNNVLAQYGKKAMIVTGRNSAKACGALQDVEAALKSNNIPYIIYNKIENNPSLETVIEASNIGKNEKVDFIIGIGGGSPIDASKAIAVLIANDMSPEELFLNKFNKALPIIAVPTTAGTGSEATPYSVLVRKDLETKVSFGNKDTFPVCAFLDPKYTSSLKIETTINTAVDAFTHVFESYLCKRSTILSSAFALEGIRMFGECIEALIQDKIDDVIREKLMYVSLLGGVVIAQTGVTIPHGMGYCYTYFKNIPHGKANGFLMDAYIKFIYNEQKQKIDTAMNSMGFKSVSEFTSALEKLLGERPKLTKEEVERFTELTLLQKGSMSNTAKEVDKQAIHYLWEQVSN
jgi:alcohol dehydrogenase class IV